VNDNCPHPDGWELHYVEPGQTLFAFVLGEGGTITTTDLIAANCLTSDLLQIGQALWLPPGAAENAPSSEPAAAVAVPTGPRTPACDPHCTISIRPGWRMEQIAAVVDSTPVSFWGADFLAAVGPGAAAPSLGLLATRPPGKSLEGYLYPGTYELSNTTTAAEFRDMLLNAFVASVPADAEAMAAAHGLTFYEALTLASIIQRESWTYEEQILISSVFHNRLRSGQQLGSTVTTQYALGAPGSWWPRVTGGLINTSSPYNTNINAGLPPTPIDSPGIDAIRAALAPADTSYLYFTGDCRAPGNAYATAYEEHLANVNACKLTLQRR
jgi:cell division protein YceG involved in septum cleavage